MLRLRSAQEAKQLAGRIPALAVLRMVQLEGNDGRYDPECHGYVVVLEDGDDVSDLPEVSADGLLSVLDPEWPGYEFLEAFDEGGKTVWEMAVAVDEEKTVAVIFRESPALDRRLGQFLDRLYGRESDSANPDHRSPP
jgi:hypothetical protein